ncbi:potassium channel family protein [Ectobacillus ponti]|uniref:NAD-binding protein n=1 Tax=Ectobacillus ponti TaxID=2961894 RepID=A0AA42BTT7_9BACI|nr:potassium channel protein [Ectobacillus ponti]MCP8969823.1 NAD-binding protein [Ectobacillus ponti]
MSSSANVLEVFRASVILRLIIMLLVFTVGFGAAIHVIEPHTFPTVADGIWWALVTIFTVGYGDLVPDTYAGRALAAVLIVIGTGFGAYYMVSFATELISKQYLNERGKKAVTVRGHIVIVGWNERVKHIVSQCRTLLPQQQLVLIDETLPTLPREFTHLSFIKGCPYNDDVMKKSNVAHASTIIITADKEKSESDADTASVLTILTAKGLNPDLYCIAEMLTSHQIFNAKRAGANEIVQANKLTSCLLTSSILFPSISETCTALVNPITADNISLVPYEMEKQESFRDCNIRLQQQNILLLGVKRDGHDYINPQHPFFLQEEDTLIVIRK